MKHWCLLLLFVNLFAATSAAQSDDVLTAERLRFQRMIARDTAALSAMLADDLVYVHSNGLTETKAAHLQSVASGTITYQEMTPVQSTAVRRFKKAAYTYGTLHVRGIVNGNPFDVTLHYSALYEKRNGSWRLLNWQSTKIK